MRSNKNTSLFVGSYFAKYFRGPILNTYLSRSASGGGAGGEDDSESDSESSESSFGAGECAAMATVTGFIYSLAYFLFGARSIIVVGTKKTK